jgi:hypothetical protein
MAFAVGELNKMLDAWVGRAGYTANAAVYAKLHLGDPGSAGTSNAATETTRQAVTFGSAAASMAISNTAAITWTAVSTTETISHLSFWTASSAGTYLGNAALNATAVATAGDNLDLPIGAFDVTLTGTKIATGEANRMLDAWAGRTTMTANAAFYLKLHTGDPGTAGTTSAAGETTRQAATFGDAAASAAISNTVAVTWSAVSTAETLTWWSAWTASSAGTFLGRDDFTSSVMQIGDDIAIPIGGLDLAIA